MFKSSNQGKTTAKGSISGSRCKDLRYSKACSEYSRDECLGKGDSTPEYKDQPCVIPFADTFNTGKQCEPIEYVQTEDNNNMATFNTFPCHMEIGIVYEGNNNGNPETEVTSALECQEICDKKPLSECTFWTYDTSTKECFLKYSKAGHKKSDEGISGSRCKINKDLAENDSNLNPTKKCYEYSRHECCGKTDSREQYEGQPCVIPREEVFEYNYETKSQNGCEPIQWVQKHDQKNIGDCEGSYCSIVLEKRYSHHERYNPKSENADSEMDCQQLCDNKDYSECKFWTFNIDSKECFFVHKGTDSYYDHYPFEADYYGPVISGRRCEEKKLAKQITKYEEKLTELEDKDNEQDKKLESLEKNYAEKLEDKTKEQEKELESLKNYHAEKLKEKTQDLKTQLENKKIEMETLKNAQKIKSSPLCQILFGVTLGASLIVFIIIGIKCQCRRKLKLKTKVQENDDPIAIDFCDQRFATSINDIKFEELKKQQLKENAKKKKKKKKKKKRENKENNKSYFDLSAWFD
jgi:hypothetical protein